MINILYIGDIMGRPGRNVVTKILPELRKKHHIDLAIAQAENVSHGKGMSTAHMRELQAAGVDFFTGGNHTIERKSILPLLDDPSEPVIAPVNQADSQPQWGTKVIQTPVGPIRVTSLLGATFPQIVETGDNPLHAIDAVLKHTGDDIPHIVNFHGDFSSEKRVIGYYLDGRVSAVIGDHWHVPTADAMVLPGGTAHITDVGMCGTLHSSLGVTKEIIISRWRDGAAVKNEIAEHGPYQFNAVLIAIDPATRLATTITPIQQLTS